MKLSEIHKDCQDKMNRAIEETYDSANAIIENSFNIFYSGGTPKQYIRQNILPGAKKIDPPIETGDSVYLKAGYEGDQIGYNTGTFSGAEVLGATMTGTYGIVGNPYYDEYAFNEILKTAERKFSKEFG